MMWNFHIDDSQGCHRYDMILRCDIFSELNIDLCLSNNTGKVNVGVFEEGTSLMKEISKNNLKIVIQLYSL